MHEYRIIRAHDERTIFSNSSEIPRKTFDQEQIHFFSSLFFISFNERWKKSNSLKKLKSFALISSNFVRIVIFCTKSSLICEKRESNEIYFFITISDAYSCTVDERYCTDPDLV